MREKRWIGLKCVGQRGLTKSEAEQLKRQVAVFRTWSICASLSTAVIAVLAVPGIAHIVMALSGAADTRREGWALFSVVSVVALFPFLAYLAVKYTKFYLALTPDSKLCYTDQFKGRLDVEQNERGDTVFYGDNAARQLQDQGLLPKIRGPQDLASTDLQVEVEILPVSGLIYSINGTRPRGAVCAYVAEVFPPPAKADYEPPLTSPALLAPRGHLLLRRKLTEGELAELQRHARRARRGPVGLGWLLTLWAAAGVAIGAYQGKSFSAENVVAVLVLSLASLLWWLAYYRGLLSARKLEMDHQLGWVAALQKAASSGELRKPSQTEKETLPISNFAWTVKGDVARWRWL